MSGRLPPDSTKARQEGATRGRSDRVGPAFAVALFLVSLVVFYRSPIVQVGDSHYSMLLSENLLRHRTFILDRYFRPPNPPVKQPNRLGQDWAAYPNDYAVGLDHGHYFYSYPPGTSILSVPFVGVMNLFGVSAANPDNTYNFRGEILIERALAALLMACFSVLAFATARLLLPVSWSALIGFATAFGTPVWSTASRAMWGHTWNIVLIGLIVYLLLAHETGRRMPNPALFASLVGFTYFVRPSNSAMIALVSLYVLIRLPWRFVALYGATGAVWMAVFFAYSQHYFKTWLPIYYHLFSQMGVSHGYFNALGGLTISPSRGILTHVPVLLAVLWLLASRWRGVEARGLVLLAAAVVLSTLITGAFFAFWHGGGSFGPRYSTDSLPWWILLSIAAVSAWRKARAPDAGHEWRLGAGLFSCLLLVAAGVFTHARGAISSDTWYTWSSRPVPMENDVARCWDWRRPQFLEGLTEYSRRAAKANPVAAAAAPPREEFPLLAVGRRLNLRDPEADLFLDGFAEPGGEQRNTAGKLSAIRFRLDRYVPCRVRFSMQPFLFSGKLDTQAVEISLNGQAVASFVLREPGFRDYAVSLPRNSWKPGNRVELRIPTADSHKHLGISPDARVLGIGVQWLEFSPEEEISNSASAPASPPDSRRIDLRPQAMDDKLVNFSGAGTPQRDTLATHAEIHLPANVSSGAGLRLAVQPFIFGDRLPEQVVNLTWNGLPLGSLTLREPGTRIHEFPLPRNFWRPENVIGMDMPSATSQKRLGISQDERILGVGVEWIEIAR